MTKMGQPLPERQKSKRTGYRSNLEADYATRLEILRGLGEIRSWMYEAVKLKIGNGAWFTPDFFVRMASGSIEFHETKGGFAREAAMVRIRSAALQFPFWKFRLVTRVNGDWAFRDM
jgi:hypothetical protein